MKPLSSLPDLLRHVYTDHAIADVPNRVYTFLDAIDVTMTQAGLQITPELSQLRVKSAMTRLQPKFLHSTVDTHVDAYNHAARSDIKEFASVLIKVVTDLNMRIQSHFHRTDAKPASTPASTSPPSSTLSEAPTTSQPPSQPSRAPRPSDSKYGPSSTDDNRPDQSRRYHRTTDVCLACPTCLHGSRYRRRPKPRLHVFGCD